MTLSWYIELSFIKRKIWSEKILLRSFPSNIRQLKFRNLVVPVEECWRIIEWRIVQGFVIFSFAVLGFLRNQNLWIRENN